MQGKPLTQTGIKISRRNIIKLRYADDTTLMEDSEGDIRDVGSTPGLERSPGGEHGNPASCLFNSYAEYM